MNKTVTQKFFPKELSWLAFNERVLQEAADENNPIIERFRFLGIYSSNMDEFYRVRVADVRRKIIIQMNNDEKEKVEKTKLLMTQMQQKILILTDEFDIIYKKLVNQLSQHNIQLINHEQVNKEQIHWLKSFFQNKVLRHITPILIEKKVNLVSRLNDSSTYYYLAIHRDDKPTNYATLEIPTDKMSRFVILPTLSKERKYKKIILLEDVIQLFIEDIFLGFVKFDSIEAYSFKMTRDSEYSINEDIAESYVEKMSDSMKQRIIAEPVRVIYDGDMPEQMVKSLKRHLKHSSYDNLVAAGKVRNVKDFIKFPNIGRSNLENKPIEALTSHQFSAYNTVFEAIQKQDILLNYPYHRFLHFTEFVRQAAFDPHVKHIRITLYRIAKNSRVVSSLIDAVDNGKMVTVVMELRARFDEEANIVWAKKMTDVGIRIVFGNPSFKIHTKICIISRDEKSKMINYAHIGTGNFNESTAKIYTDFSLFTQDPNITKEVLSIFDLIQLPYRQQNFEHLLVSPLNSKTSILLMIDNEIDNAQAGKKADIIFKVNNLVDKDIIDKLYQASQSGVIIRGIVRGMCSLRPKVKGLSDNISIISVVDRFLEHSRVMCFHNNGNRKVYISSADWMKRNLEDRIEVSCPIYDQKLIKIIINLLEIHFKDTLKARVIDKDQVNGYVKRGNRKNLRSQNETYHYLKHLEKIYHEQNQNSL